MSLTNLFITVLNMSITAACMSLVLLLLRPLLVRLPRVFSYLLWSVVLLRLLCPVSLTAAFSLLGLFASGEKVSAPIEALEQSAAAGLASSMQWAAPTPATISPLLQLSAIVWVCGMAAMLLYYIYSVLRLQHRVADSQLVGERIYLSAGINSPFVFGFLRPAIYLPAAMQENDMQLVISHEKTHIKRLDHIVKLVAFTALCVHWFNPLVWVSVLLLSRDMEMSCDEQVLRSFSSDQRKSYSLLLLELAAADGMTGAGIASFGQNDVARRIKNVLNYKNISRRLWWVAGVLSVVLVVVLATNPANVLADPQPSKPNITDTNTIPPSEADNVLADSQSSKPSITVTNNTTSGEAVTSLADSQSGLPSITVINNAPPNGVSAAAVATAEPEQEEIGFIWPLVDKGYLSAGLYAYPGHTGMDIAAPNGTEIVAAQDGVVSFAVNYTDGPRGRQVEIDHGSGYVTSYIHCSEVLVESGDTVKQGQVIAKVGKTGNAVGCHCHFEIRYNEDILDPEDYIGSKAPNQS